MNLMQFALLFGKPIGETKWCFLEEIECSKILWNFGIENGEGPIAVLGYYGYYNSHIGFCNLSKTGFSIGGQQEYAIARIYGINY